MSDRLRRSFRGIGKKVSIRKHWTERKLITGHNEREESTQNTTVTNSTAAAYASYKIKATRNIYICYIPWHAYWVKFREWVAGERGWFQSLEPSSTGLNRKTQRTFKESTRSFEHWASVAKWSECTVTNQRWRIHISVGENHVNKRLRLKVQGPLNADNFELKRDNTQSSRLMYWTLWSD